MTFIDLFEVGIIDYKDLGLTKPVKFTEEHLQKVASNTGIVNITNEHTKELIGKIGNFIYQDNILKVETPNGVDLDGKGLSPVFTCDFRDMGEYYLPIDLRLSEVGLTTSPRTGILYNTIQGDDKMSDNLRELLDKKEERVMEQQEEIALLKKQLEEAKIVANEKTELDKQLKEALKELDTVKANVEEFKADAEKLRTQEAQAKADIIKEISGDQEADYLNKLSYDELVDMRDKRVITEPLNGQSSANAEGLDLDGDQDQEEEEVDKYSEEYFNKWESENSSW